MTFEQILALIPDGGLIQVLEHPNKVRYLDLSTRFCSKWMLTVTFASFRPFVRGRPFF